MKDIENLVLVDLLKSEDNWKLLIDRGIKEHYFQFPENRKLFEIGQYYFKKEKKLLQGDVLQSLMRQSNKMDDDLKAKVSALFLELSTQSASSDFNVILDEFQRYFKITQGQRLLQKGSEFLHANDPDSFFTTLKSEILSLESTETGSAIEAGAFGDNADELIFKYHDKKKNPDKYKGTYLGFPAIDKATNGLKPGQVALVLGEMKSGKSVFMVNVAYNMVTAGRNVLYHANEGGKELIEQRFISRGTGITMDNIEFQRMNTIEEQKYELFVRSFKNKGSFYIESVPAFLSSASQIEQAILERRAMGKGPDIVLVDYLGLMQTDDKTIKSGWEKMGAITLELKSLAMKMHIPIMVIGHVNRKGMEKEKDSYDLEDMGLSLEPLKHVDLIMSWKIISEEADFLRDHIGEGRLKVIGARSSTYPEVVLQVNTNIMKIHEHHMNVQH